MNINNPIRAKVIRNFQLIFNLIDANDIPKTMFEHVTLPASFSTVSITQLIPIRIYNSVSAAVPVYRFSCSENFICCCCASPNFRANKRNYSVSHSKGWCTQFRPELSGELRCHKFDCDVIIHQWWRRPHSLLRSGLVRIRKKLVF